eukprot:Sdes_comp10704_c0_seq1m2390
MKKMENEKDGNFLEAPVEKIDISVFKFLPRQVQKETIYYYYEQRRKFRKEHLGKKWQAESVLEQKEGVSGEKSGVLAAAKIDWRKMCETRREFYELDANILETFPVEIQQEIYDEYLRKFSPHDLKIWSLEEIRAILFEWMKDAEEPLTESVFRFESYLKFLVASRRIDLVDLIFQYWKFLLYEEQKFEFDFFCWFL